MNLYMNPYTDKHNNMAIRVFQIWQSGIQGVPDLNDDADLGFSAAAAVSHSVSEARRGK